MNNNLKQLVDEFGIVLGEALLSCDLWEKKSLLSIAGINHNAEFSSRIGKVMLNLEENIEILGLPPVGKYHFVDLEMNALLLMVNLGDVHVLGCLIDKSKVVYGTLLHMIIPNIIATYNEIEL